MPGERGVLGARQPYPHQGATPEHQRSDGAECIEHVGLHGCLLSALNQMRPNDTDVRLRFRYRQESPVYDGAEGCTRLICYCLPPGEW